MKTHFASAERASEAELREDIDCIVNNPVIDGLMKTVSGLFAVLNPHRQILALNDAFLETLGVTDATRVLGLRPGESLHCVHAGSEPGGCGTAEVCSSCGAAVAIVASLGMDKTVERTCALTSAGANGGRDLFFRVRSCPTRLGERRFLLLFLQDVTREQQRAALERVFFHDISNITTGLLGACDLLTYEGKQDLRQALREVHRQAARLAREISIQRHLVNSDRESCEIGFSRTTPAEIMEEVLAVFARHPAARNKRLTLADPVPDVSFRTDSSLLVRVIGNMVTNALEASEEEEEVRLAVDADDRWVSFSVWNRQPIPPDISKRIFQRNFTTKGTFGRGLGTFSMKLLGERFLNGKVDFSTSDTEGTTFRFHAPL